MTNASTLPDGWIEITDYREALEVYRSPAIGANPGSETDEKEFRGGTVIRIDGPAAPHAPASDEPVAKARRARVVP